jgi:hypothetical protein
MKVPENPDYKREYTITMNSISKKFGLFGYSKEEIIKNEQRP